MPVCCQQVFRTREGSARTDNNFPLKKYRLILPEYILFDHFGLRTVIFCKDSGMETAGIDIPQNNVVHI